MSVSEAIAEAWANPEFRDLLMRDPHAALAQFGVEVSGNIAIKVMEDTADTMHLVLPMCPADEGQVGVQELGRVAAGGALAAFGHLG